MKRFKQLFCKHDLRGELDLRVEVIQHRYAILKCQKCDKEFLAEMSVKQEAEGRCTKRSYKTKKDALTMLKICRNKKRSRRAERVYKCQFCKSWHLTSKK